MSDPIVEEVRKYRLEHTKMHGGDLHRICEDLREHQRKSGHKVVRFEADGTEDKHEERTTANERPASS